MSRPDWRRLSPFAPLAPGDPAYVRRAEGGQRIAQLLRLGLGPVAVTGPRGSGRSTELAEATRELGSNAVACLVDLSPCAPGGFTADDVLLAAVGQLARDAVEVHELRLDPALCGALVARGLLDPRHRGSALPDVPSGPADLLSWTVAEVTSGFFHQPPVLLIDGLERAEPARAAAACEALGCVLDSAYLAVAVPAECTWGERAVSLLGGRARVLALGAVPVEAPDPTGRQARRFLREVLARRLDLPEPPASLDELSEAAAGWSGGVIRTYLRLLHDAAGYARMAGARAMPSTDDLHDAIRDHLDAVRRSLLPGDLEAMLIAEGSTGAELPLDRKVRLIGLGLLLESGTPPDTVLRPHPMARRIAPGATRR